MFNIKYYVIHNLDIDRKHRLTRALLDNGIDIKDVKWSLKPNIPDLSPDFLKKICLEKINWGGYKHVKPGYACVSYKHYLCLKDIVENNYEYAVIIEDNIGEVSINIPNRLNQYLNELPDGWDVLFDTQWKNYAVVEEEKVSSDKLVYKKNNAWHKNSAGSARVAQFYMLSKKGAKTLYENYLPLGGPPDIWMDELFKRFDMNIYWSEPAFINYEDNHKTSTDRRITHKSSYDSIKQSIMSMEDFLNIENT